MGISAVDVRKRILKMANTCERNAHIGGSLSMVELLTVLYRDIMSYHMDDPAWEDRDRFILSKGHCALALYAVLTECGLIGEDISQSFLQDAGRLGSHPVMDLSIGIESSNGSLGQGISMAVGIAKAAKLQGKDYKVYVLVGNGECDEGSVWEAAMLASQWQLDNLTVIVDNNMLQGDGKSSDIIGMANIRERFEKFGFLSLEVDGHDETEILEAFRQNEENRPKVIIGNTVKGKGISYMENNNEWHHNRLIKEAYEQALAEMEGRM